MEVNFKNVTLITNLGTTSEKTILNDVSFSFDGNKIYGILGNSNSGKSSIPELISGLITPTSGSVVINNFTNNKKIRNYILILLRSIVHSYINSYSTS